MKNIIYNVYKTTVEVAWRLLYPVAGLLLNKNHRQARAGKLGFTPAKGGIWLHAASVGEVNAVKPLLAQLSKSYHTLPLYVSTTTLTGLATAKGAGYNAFLLPLDTPSRMRLIFKALAPKLLLIAETEVWPVMLATAAGLGVNTVLVNARISAKSAGRYATLSALFGPAWQAVKAVCAQTKDDANRFTTLGLPRVQNCLNLKFAVQLPSFDQNQVRTEWGFTADDTILVFGSSRPGEEELIAKAYQQLLPTYPGLKLIIAPRHLKRMPQVQDALTGLDCGLLSQSPGPKPVLVLDTLGQLVKAYACGNIALVGGSFYDFKGHNPLEPAFYAKPVIMGPYYSSCKDSVARLQQAKGIINTNAQQLQNTLANLLANTQLQTATGQAAKGVLTANASALNKHMQVIATFLEDN